MLIPMGDNLDFLFIEGLTDLFIQCPQWKSTICAGGYFRDERKSNYIKSTTVVVGIKC